MQTSNQLWVYVCELFHIHGNSRSEGGVEFQLEGRPEFGSVSGVEFWHRGGVESGTVEVWDGASPDSDEMLSRLDIGRGKLWGTTPNSFGKERMLFEVKFGYGRWANVLGPGQDFGVKV